MIATLVFLLKAGPALVAVSGLLGTLLLIPQGLALPFPHLSFLPQWHWVGFGFHHWPGLLPLVMGTVKSDKEGVYGQPIPSFFSISNSLPTWVLGFSLFPTPFSHSFLSPLPWSWLALVAVIGFCSMWQWRHSLPCKPC